MLRQKIQFPIYLAIILGTVIWSLVDSPRTKFDSMFRPRYPDFARTASALMHTQANRQTGRPPVAALVGHHLLAADIFRDTLDQIPFSVHHVILISPNHFLVGHGRIQTMDKDFSTPYGRLKIDHQLVQALHQSGGATLESSTFVGEHGVANLLPFIKKLLPAADVTPISGWPGNPQTTPHKIRTAIATNIQPDTLLLGSFDFSHYVPSATAQLQDAITLKQLQQLQLDQLQQMAVDSPDGLWLFMAAAKDQAVQYFTPDRATNSGILTHAPADTGVTSYITGRFFR